MTKKMLLVTFQLLICVFSMGLLIACGKVQITIEQGSNPDDETAIANTPLVMNSPMPGIEVQVSPTSIAMTLTPEADIMVENQTLRLTRIDANDDNPAWSPDGRWIAFDSDVGGGNREIFLMDASCIDYLKEDELSCERQILRLTDNPAFDGNPTWSSSGEEIAFLSNRTDPDNSEGDLEVFRMSLNCDGLLPSLDEQNTSPLVSRSKIQMCPVSIRQVTDNDVDEGEPVWLQTDSRLMFGSQPIHDSNRYRKLEIDNRSILPENTEDYFRNPIWFPGAGRVAYEGSNGYFVMEDTGQNKRQLVGYLWGDNPAWSPDHRWLAYDRSTMWGRIYILDVECATAMDNHAINPHRVEYPKNCGSVAFPVEESIKISRPRNPTWAPDGSHILIAGDGGLYRLVFHGHSQSTWVFTETDPINCTEVFSDPFPDLGTLPSGLVVKYENVLYVANETGNVEPFSADVNICTQEMDFPRISPDGTQLLYEDDLDVWVLDLISGERKNLGRGKWSQWWPGHPNIVVVCNSDGFGCGVITFIDLENNTYQVIPEHRDYWCRPSPSPIDDTILLGGTSMYHWVTGHFETFDKESYGLEGIGLGCATWSPDGKRIAWDAKRMGEVGCETGKEGSACGEDGLVIVDLEEGTTQLLDFRTQIILGCGAYPHVTRWSPDGEWITYYQGYCPQGWEIIRADGSEKPDIIGDWPHPLWDLDGQWMAYRGAEYNFLLMKSGVWQEVPLPSGIEVVGWIDLDE